MPLPVDALLHAAKAEAAVAKALLAKRDPVLELALMETRTQSTAAAVVAVLVSRGIHLQLDERERLLGERDPGRLDRWLARVATCASAAELLARD